MDNSINNLLPLTKSQTSLWLVDKLNPNKPINNVPYAFYIDGNIDETIFRTAFQELINTTDVLRAVIVEERGVPNQLFKTSVDYQIAGVDFSNKLVKSVEEWLKSRAERIFDTSQQLFDSVLIKLNSDKYIWFLNVHHIITDASSSVILFGKMSKIYNCLINNKSTKLISHFSYKSFVEYELEESTNNEDLINFWESKASVFNEMPKFYGTKNIQNPTSKSNRVEIELSLDDVNQLGTIINQPEISSWNDNLSLFNVFATLLFTYIYKVSGEKNLLIAAPIHNRVKKSFKDTAGLFIEIFPLAIEIDEEDTFISLLSKVQSETNNYLKNGVTGTSSLKLARSFNVIFNYINSSFPDFSGHKTVTKWIHPGFADSGHKLCFHVYDFNNTGKLKLVFDFNGDVVEIPKLSASAAHFKNIFDAFLNNPNQFIAKSSISTKNEIQGYLNLKFKEDENILNVLEVFEIFVKTKPNAIAVQSKDGTLTFNGLNKKANQLAHYLINEGLNSNQKVVLYNYRNIEYIVGVLAIMKAGCAFIPIASDQPKERVEYIISDSGCSIVLTDGALQNNLANIEVPFINLKSTKEEVKVESEENLSSNLQLNSLAYVLYTSGSTGNPKGVLISHGALCNYIYWAKDYYNISDKTILPLFTSIGFDLTITSTLLPFISGGRLMLYTENTFGPDMSLMNVLGDNKVNTIKLTPSHLTFLKDRDLSTSNIRTLIVGGEDFKVNLAQTITNAFDKSIKIYNEYGPTEATVGCIVGEFNSEKHKDDVSVPIGIPITNMHGYILDEHKNLVPNGVVGELYLSGNSLANGYLNLEELTQNKFIKNPFVDNAKMYHTGDLARVNSRGEYEYLGRVDEQIKLRGYRIELADIESNLTNCKGVDDCAVVLVENKVKRIIKEIGYDEFDTFEEDKKLVAYYTGNNTLTQKEIKQYLSQKLPSYMVPSVFKHLEEIPLTKNGKTDKKTLKSLTLDQLEMEVSYVAPRNEIEELIEGIWKEVLRLEKIGVHDNFIALGGHSLAAIRVTSRINEELELNIPLNEVFNLPTIEAFANYLEQTLIELLEEE